MEKALHLPRSTPGRNSYCHENSFYLEHWSCEVWLENEGVLAPLDSTKIDRCHNTIPIFMILRTKEKGLRTSGVPESEDGDTLDLSA